MNVVNQKRQFQSDFDPLESVLSRGRPMTRVVADESLPLESNQSFEGLKARQKRQKQLLKSLGFKPVMIDGQKRFVKNTKHSSIYFKTNSLFCLQSDRNQKKCRCMKKKRLEAQTGRDDTGKPEVNKQVSKQATGFVTTTKPVVVEPPLRSVYPIVSDDDTSCKAWSLKEMVCRRSVADMRHRVLRNTINCMIFESGYRQIARIDDISDCKVGRLRLWPTREERQVMNKSVKRALPLLKQNLIKVQRLIGKGGQGVVFSALCMGELKLAVKVTVKENRHFGRELELMSRLKHTNLIRCFNTSQPITKSVMILELADKDLIEHIRWTEARLNGLPSFEWARLLSVDILGGLRYMHSKGFSHNDLKLENILIFTDDERPNGVIAKIADFGHCVRCVRPDGSLIKGRLSYGTPSISSPEALQGVDIPDGRLPDVWAFGYLLYFLVAFCRPFPRFTKEDKDDEQKLRERIDILMRFSPPGVRRVPHSRRLSREDRRQVRNIFRRLLNPSVSDRESIEVIANDEWFTAKERSNEFYVVRKREPLRL